MNTELEELRTCFVELAHELRRWTMLDETSLGPGRTHWKAHGRRCPRAEVPAGGGARGRR
jgi:hypothetical protein